MLIKIKMEVSCLLRLLYKNEDDNRMSNYSHVYDHRS